MILYLIQHAIANTKEEDSERHISDEGKREVIKTKDFLRKIPSLKVDKIFHSGKVRAMETAEMLKDVFNPEQGVHTSDGLSPLDDPSVWGDRIDERDEDIVLVGHLPHLNRLAGYLIAGDTHIEPIHYKNAGVVCLERGESRKWVVEWVFIPELFSE